MGRLASESGTPHFLVTNPQDVAYLTGFLGGDSYLLLDAGEATIISDFRYQEELKPLADLCDVVIRERSMTEAVAVVLEDAGVQRLGVQSEHMTLGLRQAIGRAARGVKLIETTGLAARLRARKDAAEVALIRRAIAIQEAAFTQVLDRLDEAMSGRSAPTELDVAAMLESAMKSRGSSAPGFQTIVAAGPHGAHPHYRPQGRRLKRHEPVLIDWGAIYGGYHGDLTRVVCFGRWPKAIQAIYPIVLEAHERAAAELAPGRTSQAVDAVARGFITQAGYGPQFGHGLGHGLGLDGHEDPRLTHMLEPVELEPGHVVTIEPGIYLPGVGGVRIEDDYLITPTGAQRLSSLPRSFSWSTRG